MNHSEFQISMTVDVSMSSQRIVDEEDGEKIIQLLTVFSQTIIIAKKA